MHKFLKACRENIVAVTLAVIATVLAALLLNSLEWKLWDRFIEPEPINTPVALSTRLKFDDTGVFTGEIRRALEKSQFPYRTINRVFPEQKTIVSSNERPELIKDAAEEMLDIHGGDVLIYGAVRANNNKMILQFFAKGTAGYVDCAIEVDMENETWANDFVQTAEYVATESSLTQVFSPDADEIDVSLEEYLAASESKLLALNKITTAEVVKERTQFGIEFAQMTRGKLMNDAMTLRQLRIELEDRVGTKTQDSDSYDEKFNRLRLADYYMIEGLIEGETEKIDKGMTIAIDAGPLMLNDAMAGDVNTVQRPEDASFAHWIMVVNLALACDDKQAMTHLEDQFMLVSDDMLDDACATGCMSAADAMRMLIPLSVINSHPDESELGQFRALLSEYRDFGMSTRDHWQDPFLHARRLVTRRLAVLESDGAEAPLGGFTGSQCPSLKSWMNMKGWY